MLNDTESLTQIFKGTHLEGSKIITLPVLDTDEVAFAIPTPHRQWFECWEAARHLLSQTGRWPVNHITSGFHEIGSEFPNIEDDETFSRFFFEESPIFEKTKDPESVYPQSILAQADQLSEITCLQAFLKRQEDDQESLDEYVKTYRKLLQNSAGVPTPEEIAQAQVDQPIIGRIEIERWFDQWEKAKGYQNDPEIFEWYAPDDEDHYLLLLPITNGWDSLAYINWYGTSGLGSEYFIALGKSWEKRFGAEIVSHHGTILNCLIKRPPQTIEEAWPIAIEHLMMSECSTGNIHTYMITLRDYAHSLIGNPHWFLHERP